MVTANMDRVCKDYTPWVLYRIVLIIALWIFYALVPHQFPFSSLWIVTAIMLIYAASLAYRQEWLNLSFIGVAAILNSSLAAGYNPFIFILVIFFALLCDIVNAPQKCQGE